jgi:hypothetical protein
MGTLNTSLPAKALKLSPGNAQLVNCFFWPYPKAIINPITAPKPALK